MAQVSSAEMDKIYLPSCPLIAARREVTLRVEGDRAPERLQLAADEAARSGDLRTTIEIAGRARHTIQMWSEFRVWDPGD